MTYKEAFDRISNNYCIGCEHCKPNECRECCGSWSMLEALVNDADKYRWHDLRENPEDLPPRNLPVEIRTSPCGNLFTAIFDDEKQDRIANWTFRYNNCDEDTDVLWDMDICVTAWREIEPFEEKT